MGKKDLRFGLCGQAAPTLTLLTFLAAVTAQLCLPETSQGQGSPNCFTGSPARPALDAGPGGTLLFPRDGQGNILLRPADPAGVAFPTLRDSTTYAGAQLPSSINGLELFNAVDVELSGDTPYLYAAYNAGFQIWDLGDATLGSNASWVSQRDGFAGDFHVFEDPGEFYFKIFDIDALEVPGHNATLLVPSIEPSGLTLWNINDKSVPIQIYQDTDRYSESARLAEIDGRLFAFSARTSTTGIEVYDVTRAHEVAPCFEDTGSPCGGASNPVHLGPLQRASAGTLYLDLLQRSDGLTYIAYSDGFLFNSLGVEIRRINDPLDPGNLDGDSLTNPILLSLLGPLVAGVDLFEHVGQTYLAAIHLDGTTHFVDIYDVTACLDDVAGACVAPALIYRREVAGPFARAYVSAFELGSTPMLYVGHQTLCSTPEPTGQPKGEYLVRLDGLPNVIAADGTDLLVGDSYTETIDGNTFDVDYWTSYYDGLTSGLSSFAPMRAVGFGTTMIRAGWSILDVHQWTAPATSSAIFQDGFESGSASAWQ